MSGSTYQITKDVVTSHSKLEGKKYSISRYKRTHFSARPQAFWSPKTKSLVLKKYTTFERKPRVQTPMVAIERWRWVSHLKAFRGWRTAKNRCSLNIEEKNQSQIWYSRLKAKKKMQILTFLLYYWLETIFSTYGKNYTWLLKIQKDFALSKVQLQRFFCYRIP